MTTNIAEIRSKLLKVKSPELLELNSLEDGMLKDFYKDSKKVDNEKVKKMYANAIQKDPLPEWYPNTMGD